MKIDCRETINFFVFTLLYGGVERCNTKALYYKMKEDVTFAIRYLLTNSSNCLFT